MTADLHMFIADLLHGRNIDDRDRFSLRAANALTSLQNWNASDIRKTISKVRTDLYRRNTLLSRDLLLGLLSSRLAEEWSTNPTAIPNKAMLKILFIAANPVDVVAHHPTTKAPLVLKPLGLDHEFREIESKLRGTEHRNSVQLVSRWAARPDDLLQALNEERPQIVHFSGHGTLTNELVLLDDRGKAKTVSKSAIASLFKTMKDQIRIVVLNACFSNEQAVAITRYVDCAIGMKIAIGDTAAITFAAAFYRAIGFGHSVKDSFDQGIVAIRLEGIDEDKTPRLISRKGVNPGTLKLIPFAS